MKGCISVLEGVGVRGKEIRKDRKKDKKTYYGERKGELHSLNSIKYLCHECNSVREHDPF